MTAPKAHLVADDQDRVAELVVPWARVTLDRAHRPGVAVSATTIVRTRRLSYERRKYAPLRREGRPKERRNIARHEQDLVERVLDGRVARVHRVPAADSHEAVADVVRLLVALREAPRGARRPVALRDVVDGLELRGQVRPGRWLVQALEDQAGDTARCEDALWGLPGRVEVVQVLRKGRE